MQGPPDRSAVLTGNGRVKPLQGLHAGRIMCPRNRLQEPSKRPQPNLPMDRPERRRIATDDAEFIDRDRLFQNLRRLRIDRLGHPAETASRLSIGEGLIRNRDPNVRFRG